MNKDICQKLSLIFVGLVTSFSQLQATPSTPDFIKPRITAEAITGDHTIGLLDALIPTPFNQSFTNNELLFTDIRGQISSDDSEAISMGMGYRRIPLNKNYILGGYVFYDGIDSTDHHYFQQITGGLERLGQHWDGRFNYYQPVGKKKFKTADNYSQPMVAGHSVTVNETSESEQALSGYDIELGGPLIKTSSHTFKGFFSYYHFGWRNDPKVDGERVRFEQDLTPAIKLIGSVQYDNQHHWQSYLGVRLTLDQPNHRKTPNTSINRRLTDFIIRDAKIVKARATNLTTYHTPDNFLFVDNTSPISNHANAEDENIDEDEINGTTSENTTTNNETSTPSNNTDNDPNIETNPEADGSCERPFKNLKDAIKVAKNSDVIFIKPGQGSYDIGKIELYPNQRLAGGHYDFKLPHQNNNLILFQGESPRLRGQINITHGNELKNLIIDAHNQEKHGIHGKGANFASLENIEVTQALKSGIWLQNTKEARLNNLNSHHNVKEGLRLTDSHDIELNHFQSNHNREGIFIANSKAIRANHLISENNQRQGIYAKKVSGTSDFAQLTNNGKEGLITTNTCFKFKNATVKNNSMSIADKYTDIHARNNSQLTFKDVKELTGKIKADGTSEVKVHGKELIEVKNKRKDFLN